MISLFHRCARWFGRRVGPSRASPQVPAHWRVSTWEEKAKENPLYAVMTTADMADAGSDDFDPVHLAAFFEKGRALFVAHVVPAIELAGFAPPECLVADFGCGAGRIVKAVLDAGYPCVGVDISPTMLRHCRQLVPEVCALHQVDEHTGLCGLPDESCTTVYSYAVIQHIESLALFETELREMCRMLRNRGSLAIQVNCEDFSHGRGTLGRTENHEGFSVHWRFGEAEPYLTHRQDHWSGVYIGYERLVACLNSHGVAVLKTYLHNPAKPRAIWVLGQKVLRGDVPEPLESNP